MRLLQIDAPELHGDCYGRAALRALISLAPKGTRVKLVRDPRLDAGDRYGRLLRYVFVGRSQRQRRARARGAASPYFFRNEPRPLRGRAARRRRGRARRASAATGALPGAELNPGIGSVTGPA